MPAHLGYRSTTPREVNNQEEARLPSRHPAPMAANSRHPWPVPVTKVYPIAPNAIAQRIKPDMKDCWISSPSSYRGASIVGLCIGCRINIETKPATNTISAMKTNVRISPSANDPATSCTVTIGPTAKPARIRPTFAILGAFHFFRRPVIGVTSCALVTRDETIHYCSQTPELSPINRAV